MLFSSYSLLKNDFKWKQPIGIFAFFDWQTLQKINYNKIIPIAAAICNGKSMINIPVYVSYGRECLKWIKKVSYLWKNMVCKHKQVLK